MMKQKAFMPFIKAVFEIDLVKFLKLLDEYEFDKDLLVDTKFCPGQKIPIYWITQCWEKILEEPDSWKEGFRNHIVKKQKDNLSIKEVFETQFNIKFNPIDYYNISVLAVPFFRDGSDDSDEDILLNDMQELIGQGYREIDLKLYCSVSRFDFANTERLLELGANPRLESEEYNCMDRIGGECSLLSIELDSILSEERNFNNNSHQQWLDTINLIGWAAHETMYSLLEKYDKPKCTNHTETKE